MSYLDGFIGGFGQGAREISHNMLEAQLKKYESASRIWQAMAQDENYHPAIRQKFFKNAQDLTNYDPYNKNSSKRAQDLLKLDPNQEASRAYEAMKMLNVDPESLAMYDQFGYRNPMAMAEHQNKLGLQRTRDEELLKSQLKREEEAAKRADIEKAIQAALPDAAPASGDSGWGAATEATPANSFRSKQANFLRLMYALGSKNVGGIVNPTQIPGGIPYYDESGTQRSTPGVMLSGETFMPKPEGPAPVQAIAAGSKQRLVRGEGGRMQWVVPGEPPQNSGVVQEPIQSSTVSVEDAINGIRTSTTKRGYGGASDGGGRIVPPAPRPALPPAPRPDTTVPVDTAATPKPTAPPKSHKFVPPPYELGTEPKGSSYNRLEDPHWFPGKYEPDYQTKKEYGKGTPAKKLEAAERGTSHAGRIYDLTDLFEKKFGKGMTGPIMGRFYDGMNRLGWGDAIKWAAGQEQSLSTALQQGKITPEQYAVGINAAYARIDQVLNGAEQNLGSDAEKSAAALFGELVTLSRALNGLELISMSGSGNGITRLYEMMNTAMLNPHQSPDLFKAHIQGIGFLFAEIIGNTNQKRGKGWPDLAENHRNELRKLNLGNVIPGYKEWEPELQKDSARTTKYKTTVRGKKTKRVYGSNDGINFFDVSTGAAYDPRNEQ